MSQAFRHLVASLVTSGWKNSFQSPSGYQQYSCRLQAKLERGALQASYNLFWDFVQGFVSESSGARVMHNGIASSDSPAGIAYGPGKAA